MADLNDEVNAISEHLRRLNMEFNRYGDLTAQSADAIRRKTSAETYRDNQLEKSGQAAAESLQSLYRAVGTYTSAMYEGQRGSAALNSTITQVTAGLGSLATALAFLVTPGGPLKKILVAGVTALGVETLKVATEIGNASRNMVSKQMEAYEQLASSGAIADEGLTGLGEGAARVGVSIFKMDKYLGLIGGNSGTLALFAGSVFKGRRQFEELGQRLESERSRFKLLGMDQDAMNEGMMGYIRMLNLTGRAQTMTTAQLADGAKKYLIEQDALTKLTGTSRKEAEDIKAQAMTEERFNANISVLRKQGEAGNKEADNLQNMNAFLQKLAPQFNQGFKALGDMSAPNAAEFNMALGGAGAEFIELTKRDFPAAIELLARQTAKTTELTEQGLAQFGASGAFGNRYEIQQLGNLAGKSYAEIMAMVDKGQKGQTGGKDQTGKEIPITDPRLEREIKLLDSQQVTNILLQRLINEGFNDLIFGSVGADSSQKTALRIAQIELDLVKAQVRARNPKLLEDKGKQEIALTLPEAEAAVKDRDDQVQETGKHLKDLNTALATANTELDKAKAALNAPGTEADKQIAKTELDQALRNKKSIEAAQKTLADQFAKEFELRDQARKDLEKLKKAGPAPVVTPAPPPAPAPAPPAGETEEDRKARENKAAEERTKAAEERTKAAEAKKSEIAKAKEALLAPIPELKLGGKTAFKDLVQEQKDAINNLLFEEDMNLPAMGQKPEDNDRGKEAWERQLKQSPAIQKKLFDAINERIKNDRKQKLKELEKQESDKTSEAAPVAPKDYRKNYGVADTAALADSQVAAAITKVINIAEALPTKTDINDVTAGLTINSDVATLNSKGMNMTLDNSAEVAKIISLAMTPVENLNLSQKDQSIARSDFERSMGDLRTEFSKQKATDELLLAAVQELVRIQKNGVDVQQKIYQATV